MRRDSKDLARFRAEPEALAELLLTHLPASVTDINLQAGEDPLVVRRVALPLLRILRRETTLGLSVCLGTQSADLYAELKKAGANYYIMKFETADFGRYDELQAPGSLDERLENIRLLAGQGWAVSSGFIAGLPGDTEENLLANLKLAATLPLAGCSVSPFIAGETTPLASASAGGLEQTLNSMAGLRLLRPEWAIPAVSALNLAGPGDGYRRGLRAGANLVTINMTPPGIRKEYVLYRRDRFIMNEQRVLKALDSEGLEPSRQSLADYSSQLREDFRGQNGSALCAAAWLGLSQFGQGAGRA